MTGPSNDPDWRSAYWEDFQGDLRDPEFAAAYLDEVHSIELADPRPEANQ